MTLNLRLPHDYANRVKLCSCCGGYETDAVINFESHSIGGVKLPWPYFRIGMALYDSSIPIDDFVKKFGSAAQTQTLPKLRRKLSASKQVSVMTDRQNRVYYMSVNY